MQGIKLKFKSVEQMVNNHAIGLVVLTDELETRQLNIVCDEVSMFQLSRSRARCGAPPVWIRNRLKKLKALKEMENFSPQNIYCLKSCAPLLGI